MIITCPSCRTSYAVGAGLIGKGKKVRCSNCMTTWFQTPVAEPPASAAARRAPMPPRRPRPAPVAPPPPRAPAYAPPPPPPPPPPMAPAMAAPAPMPAAPVVAAPAAVAPAPEPEAPEAPPLSEAELDAMFQDQPEPEPIESLVSEKPSEEEAVDPEKIPDPEPIPQVLTSADTEAAPPKKLWVKLVAAGVAGLVVIGGIAGLFFARSAIMAALPWTKSLYDKVGLSGEVLGAGLDIRGVKSDRETEGGIDILIVRGVIANISDTTRDVPLIRVALYDASGKEVQSTVVPPLKPQIEPAGNIGFRARLPDPSPLARRLEVTFTDKDPKAPAKDATAGAPPAPAKAN